jgi:L-ascorbate metabolism protein UlaG (beta-lactamase superfamily)
MFSEVDEALAGAQAVLITHEHPDHIDAAQLVAAARANPALRIYAPAAVAPALGDVAAQFTAVAGGTSFTAADFSVRTFGAQHALIHPLVPIVANVAYLIDDAVYHPGDSFTVPTTPAAVLCVPIHAPWSKVSEVVDFVAAVRAPRAVQIHDGLLNPAGLGLVEGHVSRIGAQYGTEFQHLDARESLTV